MQVRVILAKVKDLAGADRPYTAPILLFPGVVAPPPPANELRCPHCDGRLIVSELVLDVDGETEGKPVS